MRKVGVQHCTYINTAPRRGFGYNHFAKVYLGEASERVSIVGGKYSHNKLF